jgi:hypothetical protein
VATATTLLVACPIAVTLCYLILCAVSPWGTCLRCRPGGTNRTCRACNGTGMRPRIAWQLFAYARRQRRTR